MRRGQQRPIKRTHYDNGILRTIICQLVQYIATEYRRDSRPANGAMLVDQLGQHIQYRLVLPVVRHSCCIPQGLSQLPQAVHQFIDACMAKAFPDGLSAFSVEALEDEGHLDPILRPHVTDLQHTRASTLRCLTFAPKRKKSLQTEDSHTEVIQHREILLLQSLVRMTRYMLEAERKRHPCGRRPIPGISSKVGIVPLSYPRLRLDGESEVDQRKNGALCTTRIVGVLK